MSQRGNNKPASGAAPTSAPGGMRSASLRTVNLAEVVSSLHRDGPLSRSAICAATGLTRSSVAAQVRDLVEAGLVFEQAPQAAGRPGRPSPLVSFTPDHVGLAVRIEVDSIATGFFTLAGDMVASRLTLRANDAVAVEQIVAVVRELVDEMLAELSSPTVIGTGVAVPGLVRQNDGMVLMAPNLGWRDAPLGALLSAELQGFGPVSVGNEANLSARAESTRGAGRASADMVYVSAEFGVGGGVFSGGEPLMGRSGFGGEIGHMTVNPAGRPCGCGSSGCLETEIGGRALLERAGLSADREGNTIELLLDRASRGDDGVLEALAETGRWLGIGLSSLINIFNPDVVVLGGIYRAGFAHVIESVRAEVSLRVLEPLDGVAIVPSDLGDSGVVVGAAELAFEPILRDPLGTLANNMT